jgi:hypothetical protein
MNPSTFRSSTSRAMVATSSVSSSAVATVRVQLSSLAARLIPSRKSVRNGLCASDRPAFSTRPSERARPVRIAWACAMGR